MKDKAKHLFQMVESELIIEVPRSEAPKVVAELIRRLQTLAVQLGAPTQYKDKEKDRNKARG